MPIRPCTPESRTSLGIPPSFSAQPTGAPACVPARIEADLWQCLLPLLRGQLHRSRIIRVMDGGKQISVHVPAAWESRVRSGSSGTGRSGLCFCEISAVYLQRLRERKE